MTCPNCGTQVRDDVRFCPRCGTPLTGSVVTRQTQETPDEEKPADDFPDAVKEKDLQKRQHRMVAGLSILCAVIVIVIVLAVLLHGRGKDNVMMAHTTEVRTNENRIALFGNPDYNLDSVASITFLDSLQSVPSDAWDVSEKQNGSVMAWMVYQGINLDNEPCYDMYIAGNGGVYANQDCSYFFANMLYLTSFNCNHCFYTDNVTNMDAMFADDVRLVYADVGDFDTSNVIDMGAMFIQCQKLTDLDVSNWDTSQVVTMGMMFYSCYALQSVDVSHWDTSQVTNMFEMFRACESLQYIDVSSWDTSKVQNADNIFHGCNSLQNVPDTSTWGAGNLDSATD